MSTQTGADAILYSFDSMRDQDRRLWQAQSKDFDDSPSGGQEVFTAAKAAVHERTAKGSFKKGRGRNKTMAAPPGLKQQPGHRGAAGDAPQLPSLLRSLPGKSVAAGQCHIAEKASNLAPEQQQVEQQAGGRVQMVAKAVQEAMRAGLLPAALGESCDGETMTTRILNNLSGVQKSQVANGVNSPDGSGVEVATPTKSTCTDGSPTKCSSSSDLDSVSSIGGDLVSRPCESSNPHQGAVESVRINRKSKATKPAGQATAKHTKPGRNLPSWLSTPSSQTNNCMQSDMAMESRVGEVQSSLDDLASSVLVRDKLRARGRESVEAMERSEVAQSLKLSTLRARGHNVLTGVRKQHQQQTKQLAAHEQTSSFPMMMPPVDVEATSFNYMPMPYNVGPMPDQMLSNGVPFMPPPGLSLSPPNDEQCLPPRQAGDAVCAYLLSQSQEKTYRTHAAEQGSDDIPADDYSSAEILRVELPSDLNPEFKTMGDGPLGQEEDIFIDNLCNSLDECLPMMGSMGTSCTAEFGGEPLKIDFACLQSMRNI